MKITYLDRGNARWVLEYHNSPSTTAVREVACGDSGKARTVTLVLRAAFFSGRGPTGEDLQIHAVEMPSGHRGEAVVADAVIRMVRLIKLDAKSMEAAGPRGSN